MSLLEQTFIAGRFAVSTSEKLPLVYLQTGSSIIKLFHTALYMTKEHTSWLKKCGNGLTLMVFPVPTTIPHYPEAAGLIQCGMVF